MVMPMEDLRRIAGERGVGGSARQALVRGILAKQH